MLNEEPAAAKEVPSEPAEPITEALAKIDEGISDLKSEANKPEMGTCSKCAKEFPLDDLDENGMCSGCMAEKAAPVEPETQTQATEAKAIESPKPLKKYLFTVGCDNRTIDQKAAIELATDQVIAKKRGRIYFV